MTPFTSQNALLRLGYSFESLGQHTLAQRRIQGELTPSICEEALNRFSESEDSLAGLIAEHSIEVRDFMLLSIVCDQVEMHMGQLSRALGLSNEAVVECIGRLIRAELVRADRESITTTAAGRLVARRILDNVR